MRRSDREITDGARIDAIINECHTIRLGLIDGAKVYIVPLSFGFEHTENGRAFYFHSAREGRKLELIKRNGAAAFELDAGYELIGADKACSHSARYRSVIGTGKAELVTDAAEKARALALIMRHETGKDGWDIPEAAMGTVTVVKLTVEEISAKEHV